MGHGEYFMEDGETHRLSLSRGSVCHDLGILRRMGRLKIRRIWRGISFGPKRRGVDPGFLTFTRKIGQAGSGEVEFRSKSSLSAFCALEERVSGIARSRVPRGSYLRLGNPSFMCSRSGTLRFRWRVYREETAPGVLRDLVPVSRRGLPAESLSSRSNEKSLIPDTWLMLLPA